MTDATRCPDPDALLVLLYDDEGTPDERALLQGHVDRCTQCADLLTSLDSARGVLGAWHAPRLPLGFALVRRDRSPVRTLLWRGGLAAAAVLLIATAASLAQLEISYDAQGFRIRTGATRAVETSAVAASRPMASRATDSQSQTAPSATAQGWVGLASTGEPPWRQDMDLLATQIRSDMSRLLDESRRGQAATPIRAALATTPVGPARTMTDAELLKRVQDLLDQSEIRQQSNLALRVTELGRQFELQRQGDIVQVEQAFQRLEQQRNDLLRRVAAQQPRP
jgi:hypothetical protein